MKKSYLITLILIATLLACSLWLKRHGSPHQSFSQNSHSLYQVKMKSHKQSLYYNATISPLTNTPVLSPVAGQVAKMSFRYGETLKKGQTLAVIVSADLAENYRKDINDYLAKKDAYQRDREKHQSAIMLFNAGVISKDELKQAESQLQSDMLNLNQSRFELEKVLKLVGIEMKQIDNIELSQTSAVNALLDRQFHDIVVKSPASGIALFPEQSQSANSEKSSSGGQINVGSEVKQNDLLLMIGDFSGLSIIINVAESDINKVTTGMPASITGEAFPGIELHGKVEAVSSQAQPAQSGEGPSSFQVVIRVAKMTAEQRKVLHVGMSARVELSIRQPPTLTIPFKAVHFDHNGLPEVTVVKSGQNIATPVQTGVTTQDEITIIGGLKQGDTILVPND